MKQEPGCFLWNKDFADNPTMPLLGPWKGPCHGTRFNLKPKVEAPGASRLQEIAEHHR